jgi:hypothetical protein
VKVVDSRQLALDRSIHQDRAGAGDLGDFAGSVHRRTEVVPALAQNTTFG